MLFKDLTNIRVCSLIFLLLFLSVVFLSTASWAQTLPGPTGLSLTSTSSSLIFAWSPESGAVSYNIYRATNNGSLSLYANTTSPSYTDTGVTAGVVYNYQVAGVDSTGAVGTHAGTWNGYAIGPPSSVTVSAANGDLHISWPQVSYAAAYSVLRGTTSGGETTGVAWIGQTTSPGFTDFSLTDGVTYYYVVKCVSTTAATSAISVASPEGSGVPFGVPSAISAAASGSGQVTLAWTAGDYAPGYNIYRGLAAGGEDATPVAANVTGISYVDSGLTNGVKYYYKVAAAEGSFVNYGYGEPSATPIGDPSNLTAGPGSLGISLSWTGTAGAASYYIYRGAASGQEGASQITTTTSTSYLDTSAGSGTTYYYYIKAKIANYYSSPSNEASSAGVAVPPAPTGFAAVPGNGLVNLSWNASAGAVSYQIWRGTGTTSLYQTASSTSYSDTGVSNGTSYNYKIIALNTYGGASSSTSILNVTPIANPTGLAAAPGNAQIVLTWPADTGASGYNIYRGLSSGSESGTALTSVSGATYTYTNTGLTNGTSYFYTIKAKSGTYVSSASNEASAKPNAPPTVATAASASPSPVTGTTTNLSVLGADDGGEAALTYTWTCTGPSGVTFSANSTNAAKSATATFTQVGSYTFTATIADAGGLTAASSVAVTVNQTPTAIAVSPATVTVHIAASQAFTASESDQFGIVMTAQPTFTWSATLGAITSSGGYTAPTAAGTDTVTATDAGSSIYGVSTVTVTSVPPTVATAASATPNPVTGTTTNLSVLGAYAGGESSLTYTWTASDPSVTFSDSGDNSAKNTVATFTASGVYTCTVTITDVAMEWVSSSVIVTVNQTATSIAVTPGSAVLGLNTIELFSAQELDQFSNLISSQPNFIWSILSGGSGNVDAFGTYTAGSTTGSSTVQAADGAISGTATVTTVATAPVITVAASAAPSTVATGSSTQLIVRASDSAGATSLGYRWATVGTAPAPVTFTPNGTNGAQNTTATFSQPGVYTLQVTVTDATGLSATSTLAVTVVTPSAPTGLTAVAGNSVVILNWTPVLGATGYSVYSVNGGSSTIDVTMTADCSTFADTGLTNGTNYTYAVAAYYGSSSVTSKSPSVSATPQVQPGTWNLLYSPTVNTSSATPAAGKIMTNAYSAGGASGCAVDITGTANSTPITAQAQNAQSGTWTATWMPGTGGGWPTLLVLTHAQSTSCNTSISNSTGSSCITSADGSINVSAAFPNSDTPEAATPYGLASWNTNDPTCLAKTITRNSETKSSVMSAGAVIGCMDALNFGSTVTTFYSQTYLQSHFASPGLISITVPALSVNTSAVVSVTSSTATGSSSAQVTISDVLTGR